MNSVSTFAALASGAALWGLAAPAAPATGRAAAPGAIPSESAAARTFFEAGKFSEAGEIYGHIVAVDPRDEPALLQLGRIALLADRLAEAETWLGRAAALRPDDTDAKVLLAAAFYRADDFPKALAALDGVDVAHNALVTEQYPTLNLAKLASFKGQAPYEIHGEGSVTHLAFVRTDPLPIVKVRINGGAEVTFFIDTGNSELALDSDFAKEIGAPRFGAVQGTFSGGQHAEVQNARVDSLTLGDWTIRNVPAATLPLRQLSKGLGMERIDGCIGTNLLYHFLATLDYPGGELVLRRKSAETSQAFAAAAADRGVVAPFWMARDHFMVGWGRVESLPPALLFVDTGLADAGVKLAEPVIKAARIKLLEDKAEEGAGAAGTLKIVPYTVRELTFAGVRAKDVAGLFDGPFPWADSLGFRLDGMVGHDFFKPYAVTFDFNSMRIYLQ